ncbi:MAG: aspartate--tRNA ligase [Pyrinomonadaceae bacterium]|nr:aspartate--tRNA ligase [Pyrinomonadaceae bacterium]MCX7640444.1 aspartate--tRNA ligase [Pyrinomonadaceae bacterium]MDW8304871.1 aspartate--tRNA ligase [Acidobacteriota bacterium]
MLDSLGNLERTHTCGELDVKNVGERVVLMGWVARKRDFGIFTFLDLRDREGITQIVISEDVAPQAHAKAKQVRNEYVVAVKGSVVARSDSAVNPKIPTGRIEVLADEILILNESKTLPFEIEKAGSQNLASEELRLKYRYLDLRRQRLQKNLIMRAQVIRKIREYMDSLGFIEIETPILLKSTPEGARDFLVPSRVYKGKFYALPQSPQILKQICMIAGLDRYYQIARCFRDEDLRADRQPEFTQLDVEMSFANQEMIYRIIEGVFRSVFKLIDVDLPEQFPRLTYKEAIERFGTDKPDLRFGMELQDISDLFKNDGFAPFTSAVASGGQVKAIVVKGRADYSRKRLDELQQLTKRYGAGGLAWIKLADETSSSLMKALGEAKVEEIASKVKAEKGDAVLIVAGKKKVVASSLGALRTEIAETENLIDRNSYKPVLITEFPMFEYNEDTCEYEAAHHPFTAPMDEDVELFYRAVEKGERELLGKIRAKAYDAVINGYECAGGSIRIHQRRLQELNFKAIGLSNETAIERFGFFLEALDYGAPPHGGFAAGIERTCMIICGTENIRDVMAFPKTSSGQDLMIDSPSLVEESQLKELGIRLDTRE